MEAAMRGKEASLYVGLSEPFLKKLRSIGGGPQYIKLGRAVRYLREDLDRWLQENRRQNTVNAPQKQKTA